MSFPPVYHKIDISYHQKIIEDRLEVVFNEANLMNLERFSCRRICTEPEVIGFRMENSHLKIREK
jgi:hypothetical protein